MNFAEQHADPRRRLVGLAVVIAFHLLVVYALVRGLSTKVIDVARMPIETQLIEEIKPPPPPPPPVAVVVPPPPKLSAPPPPFVPPPEIRLPTPPPPLPTITVATPIAPPAPVAIAPASAPVVAAAPPAPSAPAPAPAPAIMSVGVVCPNAQTVRGDSEYPRDAQRQGIEKGEAVIQFTVTPAGEIKDVKAVRASNPIFARSSMRMIGEYKCIGQGRDVPVQQLFSYKLE